MNVKCQPSEREEHIPGEWKRDIYTEKETEGQNHTADSISASPNAIT